MKTTFCFLLAILFAGCAHQPVPAPSQDNLSSSRIQQILSRLLPSDFSGDAKLSETGSYLTLVIEVGNLHKNDKQEWTWDWIDYQRTFHFPLFFGMPYKQEGKVRLGSPGKK
jgi:hypothetical protein